MRLAVLGDPVEHSLSPVIHAAGLRAVGIDGSYVARRVDAAGMRQAVDEIRRGRLDGANVTMPFKGVAAELADELHESAIRAGAVNTLVAVPRHATGAPPFGVMGCNTDVEGIRLAWDWAGLPTAAPVLVLGSGGAAAAALVALEGRSIVVSARRPNVATGLVARTGVAATVAGWVAPGAGMVVVNATPIGMRGGALPAAVIDGAVGLFEMAYASGPTAATAEFRSRGLPVAEGPSMLLAQAMASFRLWTGRAAPEEAMRSALADAVSARRRRDH